MGDMTDFLVKLAYLYVTDGILIVLECLNRRIQMFPRGNNVKGLSLFLDVAYSETLPHKWCKCATFSLTVVNQIDSTYSIERGIFHFYHPYFLLAF